MREFQNFEIPKLKVEAVVEGGRFNGGTHMTDDLSKTGFAKPLGTIFNGYYKHEQIMETLPGPYILFDDTVLVGVTRKC